MKTRTAPATISRSSWWPTAWAATRPARSRHVSRWTPSSRSSATRATPTSTAPGRFPYDHTLSLDGNRLKAAFRLANRKLGSAVDANDTLRGMATTAAAVLFGHGTPTVAHVGDSRVYLWPRRRAPPDHTGSLLGQRAGSRRRHDGEGRPPASVAQRRHTRAGRRRRPGGGRRRTSRCAAGDRLILCSDGLHGVVLPDQFEAIVKKGKSLGDTCQAPGRCRERRRRTGQHHGRSCCRSMWHNLARLAGYRGLIQSLVARELKARYRGSVLGFFWSFVNPLLLLSIYSFVFAKILPPNATADNMPYEVFMFCGLLPWTWFSASMLEGTGSLIAGGNLIKKVLFPAEILPIVTVLAEPRAFRARPADPRGLHGVATALSRLERAGMVSGDRARAARSSRSRWRCCCRR